jgi:hypothetical protein
VENQFYPVVSMFLSLASLVASVGGIGLMGSLGISVVERTREIGVMRAVGAPSRAITALFIMEGCCKGCSAGWRRCRSPTWSAGRWRGCWGRRCWKSIWILRLAARPCSIWLAAIHPDQHSRRPPPRAAGDADQRARKPGLRVACHFRKAGDAPVRRRRRGIFRTPLSVHKANA